MRDALYVAGSVGFFVLMLLYVHGCDRLGRSADVERGEENAR